ncbi:MAG: PLP-dependent aminotransferase family protein [Clostridia bacterium]|nr:PLP-dependent aminotransferase family protein [Clostridia bacterium]
MLTYNMELRGSKPLFEYIYLCIRQDILSGKLKASEKLPSKRAMAEANSVSVITIANAYAQLLSEGYIYAIEKKGYFVADISCEHGTAGIPSTAAVSETATVETTYLADLTSNKISASVFPFSLWSKLTREVLSTCQKELLSVSPGQGIFELRQAIAEHLESYRGIHASPEQIIVGAGTDYLYSILVQLLGNDLLYAVENPGYSKIRKVYESHRAKCIPINLDEQGISISQLASSEAAVVHISPAHHFPTGLVTPYSRRLALLQWASQANNRFIIEDDYDSELRLTGRPIPALKSIDQSNRVIYMNTFSKTLSSTIRISYMVLPESLMEAYRKKLSFYSCSVSNLEQYTLAMFIKRGHFDRHIHRVRKQYRSRRERILNLFNASSLKSISSIEEKDAGFHFILRLNTRLTDA